jgi:hypothetical protein
MRVFDLDRNVGLAGSETCWTAPAVPLPYQPWPPSPSFVSQVGPASFPAGPGRYVLQTKMTNAAGESCVDHNCGGAQLKRAKVVVDWGQG